ncbi:hypothetical protein [Nocardia sp. NPDC051570]|uniref:hypothetical protein n=1 Tax=Nocardia sp. NPDC051570 TaxID=3364324 RepID=UPI0037A69DB5
MVTKVGVSAVAPGAAAYPAESRVLVRALAGFGDLAELDCGSGHIRTVAADAGAVVGGVFGSVGDTAMVFYRERGRLMLRVGESVVGLDEPGTEVDWRAGAEGAAWFRIRLGGHTIWERSYAGVPADGDIGRFVSEVLGNEVRRARLFAGGRR